MDGMEDEKLKTGLQASLARIFLDKGLCDNACLLAGRLKDSEQRDMLNAAIAAKFAGNGQFEKAFNALDSINGEKERIRTLNDMIPLVDRIDYLGKALKRAITPEIRSILRNIFEKSGQGDTNWTKC